MVPGPLARGAWADVEPHWSRLGWRTRDQRCGVAASGDLGGGGLWDLPSLDAEPAAGDLANSTNSLWDLMEFNGISWDWTSKIFDRIEWRYLSCMILSWVISWDFPSHEIPSANSGFDGIFHRNVTGIIRFGGLMISSGIMLTQLNGESRSRPSSIFRDQKKGLEQFSPENSPIWV